MSNRLLLYFVALLAISSLSGPVASQTIHVKVHGETIVGKPVIWNDHTVTVLQRDGALSEFSPKRAKDYKLLSKEFKLFSRSDLYLQLKREFDGYDVSATFQYLIVHCCYR